MGKFTSQGKSYGKPPSRAAIAGSSMGDAFVSGIDKRQEAAEKAKADQASSFSALATAAVNRGSLNLSGSLTGDEQGTTYPEGSMYGGQGGNAPWLPEGAVLTPVSGQGLVSNLDKAKTRANNALADQRNMETSEQGQINSRVDEILLDPRFLAMNDKLAKPELEAKATKMASAGMKVSQDLRSAQLETTYNNAPSPNAKRRVLAQLMELKFPGLQPKDYADMAIEAYEARETIARSQAEMERMMSGLPSPGQFGLPEGNVSDEEVQRLYNDPKALAEFFKGNQ